MKKYLLLWCALASVVCINAQGLENVILETYYVSDQNDATDTDGGSLAEGSVTYRIFVDLAEGYELQAVYGNDDHLLRIETSTEFFNNEDRGEMTGDNLPTNRLDENTVALDSYITMGAASDEYFGVLKTADVDGSIVGGVNNDGGSEEIAGGLMSNEDALAGIPLTTQDGLLEGVVPAVTVVGLDLSMFDDVNDGTTFAANGGAWSVLEGIQGPTSENVVLIAQITTTGDLSYELNLQLGTPDGGTEQYVANSPINDEQFFAELNFPLLPVQGCMSDTACNFDPEAEEDDESCIEPVMGCTVCNENNDGLDLVDEDNDGVCDLDEIVGCTTSETACNYNPDATDELCLEPIENCTICNENNDGLLLVDSDDDGICDADEIIGCTSETACNYDEIATDDDGSCIEPIDNCQVCNENNDGLEIVDTDGDGICDALENPGCNNPMACNYDSEATSDDGSCFVPVENCSFCNENNDGLEIIDTDEDGVCDAEEIFGCLSETACNYDPMATEADDVCIEPVAECSECNENNDGLDIIDADGDGVCDLEEVLGCVSETACNYDPLATDSEDICIEPVADCSECNENNDGLDIIDSDGDGICDAEEIVGCVSMSACNYNELATDSDDSCIEPVEDCWECNDANDGLDIIDADSDGVCDGEEVLGCTDETALNYNPDATEDDGSCTYDISVFETEDGMKVNIYPNPTSGLLQMSLNNAVMSTIMVKISTLHGAVVHQELIQVSASMDVVNFHLEDFEDGAYIMQLQTDKNVKVYRIVKQ